MQDVNGHSNCDDDGYAVDADVDDGTVRDDSSEDE